MTRRPYPLRFDPNDAGLRAAIITAMRALAQDGFAPSRDKWTAEKPEGLPGQHWICITWGWKPIVAAAGLKVQMPHDGKRLADPMQAPLSDAERHACALRGRRERGW